MYSSKHNFSILVSCIFYIFLIFADARQKPAVPHSSTTHNIEQFHNYYFIITICIYFYLEQLYVIVIPSNMGDGFELPFILFF